MSRKNRVIKALGDIVDVHAAIDHTLAKEIEKAGVHVPCHQGCAACCHQLMVCSVPEAMAAVHQAFQTDETREWFARRGLPRIGEAVDRFMSIPTSGMSDPRRTWWEMKVPCPMLRADDTCAIYLARPTPCRAYMVVGQGNDCRGVGQKVMRVDTGPYVNATTKVVEKLVRKLGLPSSLWPFPLALERAVVALGCLGYEVKHG